MEGVQVELMIFMRSDLGQHEMSGGRVYSWQRVRQDGIMAELQSKHPILAELKINTKLFGEHTWSATLSWMPGGTYEQWRTCAPELVHDLETLKRAGKIDGFYASPLPGPWGDGFM